MQAVHKIAQTNHGKSMMLILSMLLLNAAFEMRSFGVSAAEDDGTGNVSPCELESIINQLMNPSPEYQLHASALRNQLKKLLRERQQSVGEEQLLGDGYMEEDKRSVSSLAAQGLLNPPKRSLATLAKNGQLPTVEPGEDYVDADSGEPSSEQKRYIGSLARAGGLMTYGKRNVGTLARDFQLPTGKRNLAMLARLQSAPTSHREQPKRNVAAVARYNSQQHHNQRGASAEKRNLGALKSSPVHGAQQKREDEEILLPAAAPDYADPMQSYWWYPSYAGYADLDWNDYRRAEKRFLDTSKDPELFGIEHGYDATAISEEPLAAAAREEKEEEEEQLELQQPLPQKRHIGAVYRSGFLPSYRYLRSPTVTGSYGGAGGRFSRSGRDARQFVGYYYPQQERLRQPIAAVCKRCFLPNQPMINWNSAAGIRGRLPNKYNTNTNYPESEDSWRSINTNSLPTNRAQMRSGLTTSRTYPPFHSWGTPPRITALLHRRELRGNNMDNFE
ncbi:uncharacterized protein Dwil_GK21575, isoform A [Drosophila willistoni]|uniref:GK21575 n=2 Tax=Drosophila willistoni TaxID=7260 RepID=B4MPM1_DROWI|nr:neuropeptide-like 1 isoform X1 [Drosophila willistoni]EDW74060.1 uncharacterized protein Dwil_GK21575, isoform A [Drosophila willistoni]